MLLSWRKQVSVALCPDGVAIAAAGRGWRRKPDEAYVFAVANEGGVDFGKTLAVFEAWLSDKNLKGAALHVTLSDDFVRYGLMPDSQNLLNVEERKTLALACLESIHGDRIKSCEIEHEPVRRGRTALACAIERDDLQKIRNLCKTHKIKLSSLTPAFVRVANSYKSVLPESSLMLMPGERMVVGGVNTANGWASIWQQPLDAPMTPEAIAAMIQRESLLRSLSSEEPVVFFGCAQATESMPDSSSHVLVLPPKEDLINRYPLGLASLAFGP